MQDEEKEEDKEDLVFKRKKRSSCRITRYSLQKYNRKYNRKLFAAL